MIWSENPFPPPGTQVRDPSPGPAFPDHAPCPNHGRGRSHARQPHRIKEADHLGKQEGPRTGPKAWFNPLISSRKFMARAWRRRPRASLEAESRTRDRLAKIGPDTLLNRIVCRYPELALRRRRSRLTKFTARSLDAGQPPRAAANQYFVASCASPGRANMRLHRGAIILILLGVAAILRPRRAS